jgi:hypothetical protein
VYGRSFATAKVPAATCNGQPLFVNVLALDPTAQVALLVLCEGDAVALADTLTPYIWAREGHPIPPW